MVHNRSLVGGVRRGSVPLVDIGPVRQRFTAEPLTSPVPGEPSAEPLIEHVTDELPAVPATHAGSESAR
jgi:hypothetical protein